MNAAFSLIDASGKMKRCTGNQPDPNHFEGHQLLWDSIEGSTNAARRKHRRSMTLSDLSYTACRRTGLPSL